MKKHASKNLEARNLGIQDEDQSSSLHGVSSFLCLSKITEQMVNSIEDATQTLTETLAYFHPYGTSPFRSTLHCRF